MVNEDQSRHESLLERKKRLIATGAMHRAEINRSKQAIRAGLRPEALAKGLLDRVKKTTANAVTGRTGLESSSAPLRGNGLVALLPIIANSMSVLSQKRITKPAIGAFALSAAGAIASLVLKRRAGKNKETT